MSITQILLKKIPPPSSSDNFSFNKEIIVGKVVVGE